jgi:glycosyltransferase involved in cell wall biosynthesis
VVRPVLTKILPQSLLSRVKAGVINREAKSIGNIEIAKFDRGAFPAGVNLIGDIRVDTGLGESMRYVSRILDEAGVPNLIYDYVIPPAIHQTDHSCDDKISDSIKYGINIFHINASEMSVAFMDLGKEFFDNHYNIGFWLWEVEDFPQEWMPAFNLIDELWVPSDFEREIFEKITDKPVYTVPYPVADVLDEKCKKNKIQLENENVKLQNDKNEKTEKNIEFENENCKTEINQINNDKLYYRTYFNLPQDKFLFLMMYDSGSGAARKNPGKIIESFKKAFAPGEQGVGLVVKLKENSGADIDYVKSLTKDYDNIYFLDVNMSRDEVNSLISCIDVFASLHRAEGFGLVAAEAMALGTPVIATAWSATTHFMDETSACMVDYEMVELEKDYPPFRKGYRWAEADSTKASEYMRKLFDDREFYDIMKRNAQDKVHEKLSMKQATSAVRGRFADIYGEDL